MNHTNETLDCPIDLGNGTRVLLRLPLDGKLSVTAEGQIEPAPDFEILSHGNRNNEQVEAALHARMLDVLVPILPYLPAFLDKVIQQPSGEMDTPFRAAIARHAPTRH